MLSILSFFFMRGREVLEMVVSTREEVDWETWRGPRGDVTPAGDTGEMPPPPLLPPPERHLAHDLAPVEQHLVPLSEAVFGCPLRRDLWAAGRGQVKGGTALSPRRCHLPSALHGGN